ncbi:hypothetical protein H0H92_004512 [Tricholoma furcatifolium]|nr:hypothetical protein H0H92_004512 [Tricholoma furcatifolium]
MRQSVAPNRASHGAFLNTQANSSAAAAKLLEKKKEFDAVSALERASALYLERIEGLGEDCDIMADAGQVASRDDIPKAVDADVQEPSTTSDVEGQRLVRIPIDELQEMSSAGT